MGKLSEQENAWQAEATAEAVASARSIAQSQEVRLANTPVGKLSDTQWGWVVSAAIFAWIKTRYRQAVAEGLASEGHVTQMDPSPRDSAVVQSILPMLDDQASIDWSKPLAGWSKEEMSGFIGRAMELVDRARAVLERASNPIVQKSDRELDDDLPL